MIFRQWQQVLDGTKTQTRRLWNEGDEGFYYSLHQPPRPDNITDIIDANGRIRFSRSQLLPVIPKRAQKAIRLPDGEMARVRITQLRHERLQDISETDARAEGVESVEAYRALWESINGKTKGIRWADNPEVVVITFELVTTVVQEAMF